MASSIGELVVNLRANTASFVRELDKSRTASTAFGVAVGSVMGRVATGVAGMVAGAVTALPRLTIASIQLGDQLAKASQKTGVAVETLSGLKHAAELSDISFVDLTTALGRLSKQMQDSSQTSGPARRAFTELGIQVEDSTGHLRSAREVLLDLASRFSTMQDGAKKTALALEIFGRAGANLIPLLNEGAIGMAAAEKEAAALGLTMSEETTKASEELMDQMTSLKGAATGLGNELARVLVPPLKAIAQAATEGIKTFRSFGIAYREEMDFIGRAGLAAGMPAGMGITAGVARLMFGAERTIGRQMPRGFLPAPSISEKPIGPKLDLEAMAAARNRALEGAIASLRESMEASKALLEMKGFLPELAITIQPPKVQEATVAMAILKREMQETQEELDRLNLGAPISALDAALQKLNVDPFRIAQKKAEGFKVALDNLAESGQDFAHVIGTALEDAIIRLEGIRSILQGLLEDIARIILRITVTKPLEEAIAGSISGGGLGKVLGSIGRGLGAVFGGLFEHGGPVRSGFPVLVGEKRPEVFVPDVAGTILPSLTLLKELGGRARGGEVHNYYYQIDARGAAPGVSKEIMRALRIIQEQSAVNAVVAVRESHLRGA